MTLPHDYRDGHVCIIGLGYVGLTLAVAMADAGFRVTGVERSPDVLRHLREGRPHFSEVGLGAKLKRQIEKGRLVVRERIDEAVRAPVYIVTVGTPLDEQKCTKLGMIRDVAAGLSRILEPGDLVVLRSTVRVGVTRDVVRPILDRAGVLYNLAFCPERTLEGKALEELRTLPQVIGGVDEASALRAARLFHFLTPTVVRVTSAETAELAKLVNNTHRDLVFAFANEVAAMADTLGVSVIEVVNACGLGYPRGQIPMPGPVGGPCLEKDPYILAESVGAGNGAPLLALHGRMLNEALPERVVDSVAQLRARREGAAMARGEAMNPVRRIAVLGLAFKGRPETSDLRGTLAVPLIEALRRRFAEAHVVGFDAVVPGPEVDALGIEAVPTLEAAFAGTDLVVIQNNHPAFATMDLDTLADRLAPDAVIYDMWNQQEAMRLALRQDVAYAGLGTALIRRRPVGPPDAPRDAVRPREATPA
jgi:UDP-N-acetyl-D-mannosaminuronic acid dehydrogenase